MLDGKASLATGETARSAAKYPNSGLDLVG